jgi:Flp pilus assembly protein TadG
VVEFALAAPILLAMLGGIISYAGWFWMSHSLQQAVNDAARATLAGISPAERTDIADTTVKGNLAHGSALDPTKAIVKVEEAAEMVTVRVQYDVKTSPFLALALVPMPKTIIIRTAAIRLATP